MVCTQKTVFFAYFFLYFFKRVGIKLYNPSAADTEHMIMMFVAERAFVDRAALCLFHTLDEAAFAQKIQCPVHRCPGCLQAGFPYLITEGFRVEVAGEGQCLLENDGPLFREPSSPLLQKGYEELLFHN
ncbi:MAG: hypothetical protein H6R42_121 [Nitrospirae bacterium]|nr:hypothetical protein [Nitrospirota bacterium]